MMSLVHPQSCLQRKIVAVIDEIVPQKADFVSGDEWPCFDKNRDCVVPYDLSTSQDATVCGTAFDYFARFLIAQKAKKNKAGALTDLVAGRLYSNSTRWMSYGITRAHGLENYNLILKKISKYIEKNALLLEDEVAELCVLLAKMEQEHRARRNERPILEITNEDKKIVEDIRQLAQVFSDIFLPTVDENSIVVFNPTFGIGSRLVGGADADVFIDGTLYDFKVQKDNSWARKEARQLIGYYILDSIAKDVRDRENKLNNYSIHRVARYSARYAETDFFDIEAHEFDRVETAKNKIKYLYLLHNLYRCDSEELERLGIPLTESDLWYIHFDDSERLYENDEILNRIANTRKKLTAFLDQTDVAGLFIQFARNRL